MMMISIEQGMGLNEGGTSGSVSSSSALLHFIRRIHMASHTHTHFTYTFYQTHTHGTTWLYSPQTCLLYTSDAADE